MARLRITLPDSTPAVYELTKELNTIGRAPENSIQLDEPSVSWRHAELALIAENVYLKDVGSTNGTLVNDRPITDVQLRPGDWIRFGKVEACFESEVASAAQPVARLEEVEARPAESGARPVDFANAPPFQSRKVRKDPGRTAVIAAAALAFLAFLVSLITLVLMKPPSF